MQGHRPQLNRDGFSILLSTSMTAPTGGLWSLPPPLPFLDNTRSCRENQRPCCGMWSGQSVAVRAALMPNLRPSATIGVYRDAQARSWLGLGTAASSY